MHCVCDFQQSLLLLSTIHLQFKQKRAVQFVPYFKVITQPLKLRLISIFEAGFVILTHFGACIFARCVRNAEIELQKSLPSVSHQTKTSPMTVMHCWLRLNFSSLPSCSPLSALSVKHNAHSAKVEGSRERGAN